MLCDDCHTEVLAELILPRADWLRISPADGGFLCPSCVCIRAATLDGTVNVTGLITSADNSFEMYQAISALTAPTLPAGEWTDEQVEAAAFAARSARHRLYAETPAKYGSAHSKEQMDGIEIAAFRAALATITPTAGGK